MNTSELEGEKNMEIQETAGCKLELEKIYNNFESMSTNCVYAKGILHEIDEGSWNKKFTKKFEKKKFTKKVEIRSLRMNLK